MTTIVSVIPKNPFGNIWWVIVDADGIKYSTKNGLIASLADRYRELRTPVDILSFSGWYYREILTVKPEGGKVEVA